MFASRLFYASPQTQPEGPHGMGRDQQARGPVAAKATYPSPLAKPALRRQTSKAGAECGNAARPVLCGGCPVMGIPTAIATQCAPNSWFAVHQSLAGRHA